MAQHLYSEYIVSRGEISHTASQMRQNEPLSVAHPWMYYKNWISDWQYSGAQQSFPVAKQGTAAREIGVCSGWATPLKWMGRHLGPGGAATHDSRDDGWFCFLFFLVWFGQFVNQHGSRCHLLLQLGRADHRDTIMTKTKQRRYLNDFLDSWSVSPDYIFLLFVCFAESNRLLWWSFLSFFLVNLPSGAAPSHFNDSNQTASPSPLIFFPLLDLDHQPDLHHYQSRAARCSSRHYFRPATVDTHFNTHKFPQKYLISAISYAVILYFKGMEECQLFILNSFQMMLRDKKKQAGSVAWEFCRRIFWSSIINKAWHTEMSWWRKPRGGHSFIHDKLRDKTIFAQFFIFCSSSFCKLKKKYNRQLFQCLKRETIALNRK